MTDKVRIFSENDEDTEHTIQTAGMTRRELAAKPNSWVGIVTTEPNMISGWHHHGDYDTYVYGIEGAAEIEFGKGGKKKVTINAGDVAVIPKQVIHRESNPTNSQSKAFVVRIGSGAPVFNVDGPASK